MDGKIINVKWVNSQRNSSEEVKSVYVHDLPGNVTVEWMREPFLSQIWSIDLVKLLRTKVGSSKACFWVCSLCWPFHCHESFGKGREICLLGSGAVNIFCKTFWVIRNPKIRETPFFTIPCFRIFNLELGMFTVLYGFGSVGYTQPIIYGRGPTPEDLPMVPMLLLDGRLTYVLERTGNGVNLQQTSRLQTRVFCKSFLQHVFGECILSLNF